MKRHPFLTIEVQLSAKLPPLEVKKLGVWLTKLSQVAQYLVQQEGILKVIPKKMSLSLLICGDQKIRKLNHQFRGKDYVTDVLSFPDIDNLRKSKHEQEEVYLGDMAICLSRIHKQAKEFEIGFWDEFVHLFIHGFLHLCGYDHEISEKEKRVMEKFEELAISKISKLK